MKKKCTICWKFSVSEYVLNWEFLTVLWDSELLVRTHPCQQMGLTVQSTGVKKSLAWDRLGMWEVFWGKGNSDRSSISYIRLSKLLEFSWRLWFPNGKQRAEKSHLLSPSLSFALCLPHSFFFFFPHFPTPPGKLFLTECSKGRKKDFENFCWLEKLLYEKCH